ncbi:hypothetical protein K458DRAFT_295582 [Lentithecium fluviatile CBS 122367]|uniref:Oxidative stress survival, Svf1-like protein n=1 Tax=Lentithecium fluviatile CBS 122367 TaxID=1168545 RepID=A0A6G1JAD0_9PLEO|nr:hypothetical protein K458DRAFT_295582 [Lentithecium fluviatile CBS 122367]
MSGLQPTNAINRVGAESAVDGPAPYEKYQHDYFPKFACLSKSHWELWIFDAVDPEANAAVTMTFFRDGSQLKLGKGPLRVTFQAYLPDGSTLRVEDFSKESIVEVGSETVRGRWITAKDDSKSAQFEVRLDLSEAVVTFDLPALQGTLRLSRNATSTAQRKEGDSDSADRLAPAVYYVHSIPRAAANIAFTFPEQDKTLSFNGLGGSDHCYMTASTPAIMEACTYVRGHAGPYTFSLMRIVSRIEPGETFTKVTLVQEGKEIFTCTSDDRVSLADDYFCFRSAHGGQVRGSFSDSASGYKLDCVSPSAGKHWSFKLKHQVVWWSMPTAPPPAKTGNNGFVDIAVGGEVGGSTYEGSATVGYVELPVLKSQYSGFNNHP